MIYRTIVTDTAKRAIAHQISYITNERQEPLSAARVLGSIDRAIDSLASFPHRFGKAPEDEHVGYTVRQLVVKKSFILLYRVDDVRRKVTVVGFRHAHQLPLTDLPDD